MHTTCYDWILETDHFATFDILNNSVYLRHWITIICIPDHDLQSDSRGKGTLSNQGAIATYYST